MNDLQKEDEMEADHQPQASLLKYAVTQTEKSNQDTFTYRVKEKKEQVVVMREAIGGKRADGALTINLHKNRHKEGRTWFYKSNRDGVLPEAKRGIDTAIKNHPDDYPAQRTAIIEVFEDHRIKDV